MVTSAMCFAKYGDPEKQKNMVVWDVPTHLEIGVIPKKIYCNRDMVAPLQKAFENLIKTGRVKELKTWDGCFNIRKKRGLSSMSLHSWGIAVDVNAFENGLGKDPKTYWSQEFQYKLQQTVSQNQFFYIAPIFITIPLDTVTR